MTDDGFTLVYFYRDEAASDISDFYAVTENRPLKFGDPIELDGGIPVPRDPSSAGKLEGYFIAYCNPGFRLDRRWLSNYILVRALHEARNR